MPFLPIADISNLFELFFFQNYPHTPTHYQPQQDRICSFPRCLFCLSLIFQICLNYFFSKIIHIHPAPCDMPRQPTWNDAIRRRKHEVGRVKWIQSKKWNGSMYCESTSLEPAIAGNIKASSEPSHICFFHPPLIFQICLNYFFPKIIHIPLPAINHNKAASAPSLDAFFAYRWYFKFVWTIFSPKLSAYPTLPMLCRDYQHAHGAPNHHMRSTISRRHPIPP
jgi:hypothetical protein